MSEDAQFDRVLITGIRGSGGSYLAEYVVRNHPKTEVHGLARWHSTTGAHNLEEVADVVHVHECDMNDFSSLFSACLRSITGR